MPGFPDKFMPFMESMPITWRSAPSPFHGSPMAAAESETYGSVIRSLREFALREFDTEPQWRQKGAELVVLASPHPFPGRDTPLSGHGALAARRPHWRRVGG